MNRRDALRGVLGLGTAAALLKGTPAAAAPKGLRSNAARRIFKVRGSKSFTHVTIGDDTWDPTPEQVDAIVAGVLAAQEDPTAVLGTRQGVTLTPVLSFALLESRWTELRRGDLFVLYEPTGELVKGQDTSIYRVVDAPEAVGDSWQVNCEEVDAPRFAVPEHLENL